MELATHPEDPAAALHERVDWGVTLRLVSLCILLLRGFWGVNKAFSLQKSDLQKIAISNLVHWPGDSKLNIFRIIHEKFLSRRLDLFVPRHESAQELRSNAMNRLRS